VSELRASATADGYNPLDTMVPQVAMKRSEIARLCDHLPVLSLDVFGSANSDRFDEAHSDVDFVARFSERAAGEYLSSFLALAHGLERILGRPVDLLTEESIRNRHFKASVEISRERIYERSRADAAG